MAKKKLTLSKSILGLLIGIPTLFNLVSKTIKLIGLEANLASKSLISIIILSVIMALLCTTTWICIMLLIFFYLISLTWTTMEALLIIILLNVILLIIVSFSIVQFKKKLLFPETRRRIRHARKVYEDL